MTAGIYIHLPFCSAKCFYCDFYSYIHERDTDTALTEEKYTEQLIQHIATYAGYRQTGQGFAPPEIDTSSFNFIQPEQLRFDTLYIGGGTPSFFAPANLAAILRALEEHVLTGPVAQLDEVTIEVNPESFSAEKDAAYLDLGVNRYSMGIQSLNETGLKTLGRNTGLKETRRGLELLADSKVARKSVDYIFGYPGQTRRIIESELTELIAIQGLNHISSYGLTLEKGTGYYRDVLAGKRKPPNDDLIADSLFWLPDFLAGFGFNHYEISNFGRGNDFSLHNLHYWKLDPYLAFGASAHGYLPPWRYKNAGSFKAFLQQSTVALTLEEADLPDELAVTLFRLQIPIPIIVLAEFITERQRKILIKQFEVWQSRGLAKIAPLNSSLFTDGDRSRSESVFGNNEGLYFQWTKESLARRDSYLVEILEALE